MPRLQPVERVRKKLGFFIYMRENEEEGVMGEAETLTCHTTNRDGYWEYKIDLKICADCSTRHLCTHSKDCAKAVQRSVPGIQPGED